MYKIEFKTSVLKDIKKIPKAFLNKIENSIHQLSEDPIPKACKKIQGYKDHYRLRIGMYRIIYRVGKKIEVITIIKIGQRKEVYKSL